MVPIHDFTMDDKQFKFLSFSITFLVFIFMVFRLRLKSTKLKDLPKNLPPSPPWKLPIIGHLHLLISALPHRRLTELAKTHGSVMHLQLGELSNIVVSSPEAAKQVMKTHDIIFANRPFLLAAEIITYNSSDIAFSPYGAFWRQLRKICTLELLSTKRVQSFRSIREEEVSSLISSILTNAGSEINLGEMLCNLSYSINSRIVFSGRCKQHELVISLTKEVMKALGGFSIADLFPSIKLLPFITGMGAKLKSTHHDLDTMIESIIEEHRAKNENPNKGDDDVRGDLVDVLLRLQRHGGLEFPLTTENIKAVILVSEGCTMMFATLTNQVYITDFQDMIMAGTETSSTTTEWAMSAMIKNPRILEKAQAEVRRVYNRIGDVNESDHDELKYLKLVIKETLRLHPPGPLLLPRESTERCEINGYEIPTKSKVIINAWAIGRDPDYWIEAERFIPERFIDSSIDYKGANFEFIPFGAGRRMCPGMSFAMVVLELSLAHLLYHFDWKLPNGIKNEDLDMTEIFGASVRRKTDLHLIPIPYYPPGDECT